MPAPARRPRSLVGFGQPIGTQLNSARTGKRMHAVGCVVDGGPLPATKCARCTEDVADRIDAALTALDRRAGA